jgi:hypothetical protein
MIRYIALEVLWRMKSRWVGRSRRNARADPQDGPEGVLWGERISNELLLQLGIRSHREPCASTCHGSLPGDSRRPALVDVLKSHPRASSPATFVAVTATSNAVITSSSTARRLAHVNVTARERELDAAAAERSSEMPKAEVPDSRS